VTMVNSSLFVLYLRQYTDPLVTLVYHRWLVQQLSYYYFIVGSSRATAPSAAAAIQLLLARRIL